MFLRLRYFGPAGLAAACIGRPAGRGAVVSRAKTSRIANAGQDRPESLPERDPGYLQAENRHDDNDRGDRAVFDCRRSVTVAEKPARPLSCHFPACLAFARRRNGRRKVDSLGTTTSCNCRRTSGPRGQ